MTLHATIDSDPDPSTQIPWPRKQGTLDRQELPAAPNQIDVLHPTFPEQNGKVLSRTEPPRRLSSWNLFTLSIGMAGSQIAWTVELGYGTPFLLSLGLSEQLTSLVWLAGPISGLIAQPIIGAISDSSTSKYRRRYWIAMSTVVLVVSTLVLAYCQDLALFIVDILGRGLGDSEPKRDGQVASVAIALAIFCFYLLDFALNALQASLRNLLLDITPHDQLNAGNAWHGRMTHAGNIIGFGFGFLPLADLPILRWLGGDQFRKFCIVAMVILVIAVWITCICHEEKAREKSGQTNSRFLDMWNNIRRSIITLPKPIRRVCYVQLFAFMGWFPFLFYSTTYVGQVMAFEHNAEPDRDLATRKGEFAMLIYSLVAVSAGTLLPHLAARDRRLFVELNPDEDDPELTLVRHKIREWRAEAARQGNPLRLPVMPFLLRNIWTGALLLFSVLTFSTFFISTVLQATIMIGLVGICWAVAIWVPFAIVMEFLKEMEVPGLDSQAKRPAHVRTISTPPAPSRAGGSNERQPLLRRRSFNELTSDIGGDAMAEPVPIAGGTVLGIHNLAIVLPQLLVAVASSLIFRIVDGDSDIETGNTYLGKNGVAWVLRFGGFCTFIGALIARRVPPTRAEKQIRRILGELRDIHESGNIP